MIVLGLTGSIGMGKSTTAAMFREAGVPVHDSDEAVHRLYRGAAVPLIEADFPGTTAGGVVDRELLAKQVLGNPAALKRLEAIVHPLVRADAEAFLERHRSAGAPVAVLDIPLLFETGAEREFDSIFCVACSAPTQRERLRTRGWTDEQIQQRRAAQIPVEEKMLRAHPAIWTEGAMDVHAQQVHRPVPAAR